MEVNSKTNLENLVLKALLLLVSAAPGNHIVFTSDKMTTGEEELLGLKISEQGFLRLVARKWKTNADISHDLCDLKGEVNIIRYTLQKLQHVQLLAKSGLPVMIYNAFYELINELSPENIESDGELPDDVEGERKLKSIHHRWRELERQAGRSVKAVEIWDKVNVK